jgi:flagellar basal-body rod protein FlgG
MAAHQARLDILANNLANADTPGFKADLITIDPSDAFPDDMSAPVPGAGIVRPGRAGLDASSGVARHTGNPMEMAIVGSGLFVVETPQGERYTRAGSFARDGNGFLATSDGFRVLSTAGPVRVPEGGLQVDAGGQVSGGGTLRIVAGPDATGFTKVGANLYAVAEGATPPADQAGATVLQGHLEASNVNVVHTMVTMLATLRTYETCQRMVQAIDQTAGQAAGELGRA